MKHGALMHNHDDDVAVVVQDVEHGTSVQAVTLEGQTIATVTAVDDVPLGHKIAVRDVDQGKDVIKYGRSIGEASEAIKAGAHVHTHNIKSKRWA